MLTDEYNITFTLRNLPQQELLHILIDFLGHEEIGHHLEFSKDLQLVLL